jgi:Uncharacterized Rossmann fold enzyme
MQYSDWYPVYRNILEDMGYSQNDDESSARLLKMIMCDHDLIDDDELETYISENSTIYGGAYAGGSTPSGTVIATGASIPVLLSEGVVPDIIVTDLDGDLESQKKASLLGSVTVMHAHGDNTEAIMEHAKDFQGKVILTTQSRPDLIIYNFGGFTDGDRAVCLAKHFRSEFNLEGFDLDNAAVKDLSDPNVKNKKLQWAKRIIFELFP